MSDLNGIEEYLRKKYPYETERKAYIFACCKFIIDKFIENYIKDDLVLRHEIMEEFRLKFKRSMDLNGIQELWVDHHKILDEYKNVYHSGNPTYHPPPRRWAELKEDRIHAHAKAFGIFDDVCPDFIKAQEILNS